MKNIFQSLSANTFNIIFFICNIFFNNITLSTGHPHHCRHNHYHHDRQIIDDFFPLPFFENSVINSQRGGSLRVEDAQLVNTLNQQLVTAINGAHILVAYLDAEILEKLSLAELTEEMTFLTDAYLQPALSALDDKTFHANLLYLLPRIANDTVKLERLFCSLAEYLPPYSLILKSILTKSVSNNKVIEMIAIAKNSTKSYNTNSTETFDDFVATSIVLETGFEYLFHLVTLYSKLLQVPKIPESSGNQQNQINSWLHSTIVSYPLANTEGVFDILYDLLTPLNDLAVKNSISKQCTGKLLKKISDSLKLIKGRLKMLKLSASKTSAVSLLEKIETMEKKLC